MPTVAAAADPKQQALHEHVQEIFKLLGLTESLSFHFLMKCLTLVQIFDERQHDYGPANIAGFGELGVLVRASDKFDRLKHVLWDRRKKPVAQELIDEIVKDLGLDADATGKLRAILMSSETRSEKLDDSWADLANYGIIALLLRDGTWPQRALSMVQTFRLHAEVTTDEEGKRIETSVWTHGGAPASPKEDVIDREAILSQQSSALPGAKIDLCEDELAVLHGLLHMDAMCRDEAVSPSELAHELRWRTITQTLAYVRVANVLSSLLRRREGLVDCYYRGPLRRRVWWLPERGQRILQLEHYELKEEEEEEEE